MLNQRFQLNLSRCVLALNEHSAEWLDLTEAGCPRYGQADMQGSDIVDYLRAAQAAIANSGQSGQLPGFVLALGNGLSKQRFFQLPTLKRGDRRRVLERKARRLMGRPKHDVVFRAQLFDPRGRSEQAEESSCASWMLSAASRAQLRQLMKGLEASRLRPERVILRQSAVWSRALSLLDAGDKNVSETDDTTAGALVVSIEPDGCSVALLAHGHLITRYMMKGSYFETPSMSHNLLQDIRNCAAFWRQISRGAAVKKAFVFGLDQQDFDVFRESIQRAIQGVMVQRSRLPQGPSWTGAMDSLEACLDLGALQAKLPVRSERMRRTAHRLVASACLGSLAVAGLVSSNSSSELLSLEQENALLANRVSSFEEDAGSYWEIQRRSQSALKELEALAERTSSGLPFGSIVESIRKAFRGRAILTSVSARTTSAEFTQLSLNGDVSAKPLRMMTLLDQIERALSADGMLESVEILPSSQAYRAGGTDGGESSLTFSVSALVRRGGP